MNKELTIAIVTLLAVTVGAIAAPSLPITKPPVQPMPSWTGPVQDPHAVQGQWFLNPAGREEARSHEFHDNPMGLGGGFAGTNAIYGKVINVQMAGPNIIGLTIQATVTNDTPGQGPWPDGTNSHEEWLSTPDQYFGTLYDTKLTAEFAVTDLGNLPPAFVGVYRDRNPYIIGLNEDQAAWYCWTPNNPDLARRPWGNYYVPTWDFGNILPGQSATRILNFAVSGLGLTPADVRYGAIMNSWNAPMGAGDVFLNRTTDLKIGDWIDDIALDGGQTHPQELPLRDGDVSVFHNIPEPATLGLLVAGSLLLHRRR